MIFPQPPYRWFDTAAGALLSGDPLPKTLRHFLRLCCRQQNRTLAGIWIRHRKHPDLEPLLTVDSAGNPVPAAPIKPGSPLFPADLATAAQPGQCLELDCRQPWHNRDPAPGRPLHCLSIPLIAGDELIGLLLLAGAAADCRPAGSNFETVLVSRLLAMLLRAGDENEPAAGERYADPWIALAAMSAAAARAASLEELAAAIGMPLLLAGFIRRCSLEVGVILGTPNANVTWPPAAPESQPCINLPLEGAGSGCSISFFYHAESRWREHHLAAILEMGSRIAAQNLVRLQRQILDARQDNRQHIHMLTFLHQVKNVLLTETSPDGVVNLALGALVCPHGFGFDRAMMLKLEADPVPRLIGVRAAVINQEHHQRCLLTESAAAPDQQVPLQQLISCLLTTGNSAPNSLREQVDRTVINLPFPHQGPLTELFARRQPQIISAPADYGPLPPPLTALLAPAGSVVLPLTGEPGPQGMLITDFHRRAPDPALLPYLTLFADTVSLALEQVQLYRQESTTLANLRTLRSRLVHYETMTALGEMAASIAHEIKNPLVSIGGFARRLQAMLPEKSREQQYGAIIIKEINRLERIVNDILGFSRSPSTTHAPCRMNDLAAEVAELFARDAWGRGVEVLLDLDPDLPTVEGDPYQLRQVLINLIANAIQASWGTGGGQLTITTACADDDSDTVTLTVEDTAAGIPPEIMHNIFNPFFTTKDEGTGLGLPICHKIIMNHQGTIQVSNRPAGGARFEVTLPVRQAQQLTIRPAADNHL
ncbi:MAG: hypothetical protein JW781_10075 [Deltaproteobacteria bacterium]|nr:hypothetical protein [Candidatus Anaeroferrophillacea bacterium]